MRKMARGSGIKHRRVAAVLTMTLTVAVIAMFLVSHGASAATGPKQVRGYIRDVDGRVLEGIPVTINILLASDNNITRATLTTTSDATGYFSKTFGPADWDVGDRIQVIATHGARQESNSTIAIDYSYQWCNVTFPYAIPEFGSSVGFLIAGGLIAAVAAVFLVSKRKK